MNMIIYNETGWLGETDGDCCMRTSIWMSEEDEDGKVVVLEHHDSHLLGEPEKGKKESHRVGKVEWRRATLMEFYEAKMKRISANQ